MEKSQTILKIINKRHEIKVLKELLFLKEIVLTHFHSLFRRSNRDAF